LKGIDIRFFDGREEVFMAGESVVIHGEMNDRVSLVPLNGSVTGVSTHGLKYPLDRATLFAHKTRGISNQLNAQQAEVTVETGTLLCIHRLSD